MAYNVLSRSAVALTVAAALVAPQAIAPQAVFAAAPAPTLINDGATAFGDWYVGAVPANSSTKPVILFVQGLHSDYKTWYKTDGFYDAAYNAGYRTAFVQLKDADGGGGNMWTNGPVLANVIKKVAARYGVSKINIVAHSKGGIDTQTALVHYGAHPYVNVVHQLATPNKGSELADLAYSAWVGWLASIIGQQDEAVYSLQTSYMSNFRAQTDGRSENNSTKTYMAAGTGDDGWFSATWTAHAFIPGEDDGAVAYYSATGLPNGIFAFKDAPSGKLSHGQITLASKTWSLVQPKLTTATTLTGMASDAVAVDKQDEATVSNSIFRGGAVQGKAVDSFKLEAGVDVAAIDVMTAQKDTKVTLVSPSGVTYTADTSAESVDPANIFAKVVHNTFKIAAPEKGTWTVNVEGQSDAYFMAASLEGGAQGTVKANKKVLKAGEALDFSVDFAGSKFDQKSLKKATLTKSEKKGAKQLKEVAFNAQGSVLSTSLQAPTEAGVYNLSFDVTGVDAAGNEFTRSVNYNFAVANVAGKVE